MRSIYSLKNALYKFGYKTNLCENLTLSKYIHKLLRIQCAALYYETFSFVD